MLFIDSILDFGTKFPDRSMQVEVKTRLAIFSSNWHAKVPKAIEQNGVMICEQFSQLIPISQFSLLNYI